MVVCGKVFSTIVVVARSQIPITASWFAFKLRPMVLGWNSG